MAANFADDPKFSLGNVVMTSGAEDVLNIFDIIYILERHQSGDWGDMDEEDQATNEAALNPEYPQRLMSSYEVNDETVWVITEFDRSVTTILLPEEY